MSKKLSIIFIFTVLLLIAANEFFIGNMHAETVTASSGEALIGGQFSLTDQNGNKFTEANLKGKYSLVYFGFTHCPDICPTTLANIGLALNEIGYRAKEFQVVFITADPERDDVKAMKEYVSNFNYPIIALTGTAGEVKQAESVYKVYAEKVAEEGKQKGDYNITHSSIIYIMDKNAKFLSNFSYETRVEEMASKLKQL